MKSLAMLAIALTFFASPLSSQQATVGGIQVDGKWVQPPQYYSGPNSVTTESTLNAPLSPLARPAPQAASRDSRENRQSTPSALWPSSNYVTPSARPEQSTPNQRQTDLFLLGNAAGFDSQMPASSLSTTVPPPSDLTATIGSYPTAVTGPGSSVFDRPSPLASSPTAVTAYSGSSVFDQPSPIATSPTAVTGYSRSSLIDPGVEKPANAKPCVTTIVVLRGSLVSDPNVRSSEGCVVRLIPGEGWQR